MRNDDFFKLFSSDSNKNSSKLETINSQLYNTMKKTYIIPSADVVVDTENLMETLPVSPTEVGGGYGKERDDAESEQSEQKDAWKGGLW